MRVYNQLNIMINHSRQQPIGIFDSGVGGLTVAKALLEIMPNESIVYFGDTAHLPYGDKSQETICSYSLKIFAMLLHKYACKLIVIACSSATAASIDAIQKNFSKKVLITDAIDPVVEFLQRNHRAKSIGLIGTKLTVRSEIYDRKLAAMDADIALHSLATPLLVPIIEEGFCHHELIDCALQEYLSCPQLQNIEALILSCTHYPIIKEKVTNFYCGKVAIVDPAHIVAQKAHEILKGNSLLNDNPSEGMRQFFVSDYTETFVKLAKRFFGQDINLTHYPW